MTDMEAFYKLYPFAIGVYVPHYHGSELRCKFKIPVFHGFRCRLLPIKTN